MPDLGKYAFEVLSSYGVGLLLLIGLLLRTISRGRAARATLAEAEAESARDV